MIWTQEFKDSVLGIMRDQNMRPADIARACNITQCMASRILNSPPGASINDLAATELMKLCGYVYDPAGVLSTNDGGPHCTITIRSGGSFVKMKVSNGNVEVVP